MASTRLCLLAVVFLAGLAASLPADSTMQSSSSVSASFSSSSVQQSASASVSSPDKKQLVKTTTTTTTSTTTTPDVVPLDKDEQQPDYKQPEVQPEPEPEPKPEPEPEPEPKPVNTPVDTDDTDLQNLQPNREQPAVLKPVEATKADVEEEPNGNSIQQQASGNPEEDELTYLAKDDLAFVHDSIESTDEDELVYRHDQPEWNEVMVGDGPATAENPSNTLTTENISYEDDEEEEEATEVTSKSVKLVKIEKDDHQKSVAGNVPEQNTADDEDDEEDDEEDDQVHGDELSHEDEEEDEYDESSSPRPHYHDQDDDDDDLNDDDDSDGDDIEPTAKDPKSSASTMMVSTMAMILSVFVARSMA